MRRATLFTAILVLLSLLLPALAQSPPPYIQPGLLFRYQMIDLEKRQPENAFHNYIIESVTPQGIRIAIQSDVIKSGVVTVNANGEFKPGERIDLWIPPGLSQGARLRMMGVDAVVVQTGVDTGQGLKVTYVAAADQSIVWGYIEDGAQPHNQFKGLLLFIFFPSSKKGVGLVNIEQAGAVTTTSTYTSTSTYQQTSTLRTMRTTVVGGTTVTATETSVVTTSVVSTVTATTVSTYSTTSTATVTAQAEAPPFPIPLTVAIPVAAVIIGGGFFYMRSRKRPLPPTYPYPSYPMPPPGYPPQQPWAPTQRMPAMACPACRFPVYPGEFVCRRCGFRVR